VRYGRGKYYALLGDFVDSASELQEALTLLRREDNLYSVEGKEVVTLYLRIARALDNFDKIEELEGILELMDPS
jgi:hypothetical protein